MNEKPRYILVAEKLFAEMTYCPVCGKKLEAGNDGAGFTGVDAITMKSKLCSDGHGEMGLSLEYPDEMVFSVNKSLYREIVE